MDQNVHVMDGALRERVRRKRFGIQVDRQSAIQQQVRIRPGNSQDRSAMAKLRDDCVFTK